RHDLVRDEVEVVEVMDVEDLQVDAAQSRSGEGFQLRDDLFRGTRQAVGAQFLRLPADGRGTARDLGVVTANAQHEGRRIGEFGGVAFDRPAGVLYAFDLRGDFSLGREGLVVFGGELGRQPRCALLAATADDDR